MMWCVLGETGALVGAIHESPVVEYTSMGHHVEAAIQSLPSHIPVIVDSYVIMPNHVHLMVLVSPSDVQRAIRESPLHCRSVLSRAVGYIKSTASKTIHRQYGSIPVWQRGYHDHVVRNSKEYDKINAYIHENPLRWELDILYNHGMEALDAAVDKVSEE